MASRNIYGAVNGITFEAFILKELVPKLWKGACVIMDKAKIYCGEMVKEFIEEAGAKLIYLSPYSTEFSPKEKKWSKVKSILTLFCHSGKIKIRATFLTVDIARI